MKVVVSVPEDYNEWLNLARQVEYLFGPMVEDNGFQKSLRQAINDGEVYCIRNDDSRAGVALVGGIIISKKQNEILWLAVSNEYRNVGAGKALLSMALEQLDKSNVVTVITFDEGAEEGKPARRLYLSSGFVDNQVMGKNPAGFQIIKMILKR